MAEDKQPLLPESDRRHGLQLRGQLRIFTGFPINPESLVQVREPLFRANIRENPHSKNFCQKLAVGIGGHNGLLWISKYIQKCSYGLQEFAFYAPCFWQLGFPVTIKKFLLITP